MFQKNTDLEGMISGEEYKWAEEVFGKIRNKLEWVREKTKEKLPYTTINGTYDNFAYTGIPNTYEAGRCYWTNGFWAGIMWQMYHATGEKRYAEIAGFTEKELDQALNEYYGLHHDVGFMWLPSAVADYRITGNPDARRSGLHAASLLAGRFNPAGRFIRAWNENPQTGEKRTGWAIIDCLMNLPLLYWASDETEDPRFRQIAVMHADTVAEHFIRQDGSSNHIVEFDPLTGEEICAHGGQGYQNGSAWTRGQGWAVYGFVLSWRHTGKQLYLDTARRAADYFIANIPDDGLIPVDFRAPAEPRWEDSSAAAIAACGLLEIAACIKDDERRRYFNAAVKLLRTLAEYRCNWSEECDNIVEKCTVAYHTREHEKALIYGDYFFIEAVLKLLGKDLMIW